MSDTLPYGPAPVVPSRDAAASPPGGGAAREPASALKEKDGLAARLEQLERELVALGGLREGTRPLLDGLREGTRALEPGPGGTLPTPKERGAWRTRMGESLEVLEDVLEGLQLAARADTGGRRD